MKIDDIRKMDDRIENGAWTDSGTFPGVRYKVRGDGCSRHERVLRELWGKVPTAERTDPAVLERVGREALLEAVLIDWEGIEDAPYSREEAAELLKGRTFMRDVMQASVRVGAG